MRILHLATYNANALPQNTQLSPTLDDQGKQITARVEGKELPVWTLTTVNPERQTVGTAQVVKLEGDDHLYTLTGHPVVNYQAVHLAGHVRGLRFYPCSRSGPMVRSRSSIVT